MRNTFILTVVAVCLTVLVLVDSTTAQTSSCIAWIEADKTLGMQNAEIVVKLIDSNSVSGNAEKDVFGMKLDEVGGFLKIEVYALDDRIMMVQLVVDGGGMADHVSPIQEKLDEYLAQTLKNLSDALGRAHDQVKDSQRSRLDRSRVQLEQVQQEVEEYRALARAIREKAGTAALSLDALVNRQMKLEQEVLDLRLQQEVVNAVRRRLSERIAEAREKAEELAERDETLEALHEVAAMKEELLGHYHEAVNQGLAPSKEYIAAKAELAEVRIRIADRLEQVKRGLGGETLAALNERLNETLIESDRVEAMYHAHRIQLEQMKDKSLFDLAEQYEQVRQRMEDAMQEARHFKSLYLEEKIDLDAMTDPRVIVVE